VTPEIKVNFEILPFIRAIILELFCLFRYGFVFLGFRLEKHKYCANKQ
jgi:hypothetical protein